MASPQHKFDIAMADSLKITDTEISELLAQVYVAGGFTTPDEATALFDPAAVRKRGILIGARQVENSDLAGIVIVVPPDSTARRLAQENEVELHLLGVKLEYRQHGLGRLLVEAAVDKAGCMGYEKMILWTQLTMNSAQLLYESTGFHHVGHIERNGRKFKVYERVLRA
jgi:ribosomal protein S18 acetylase RimI-like enzyme